MQKSLVVLAAVAGAQALNYQNYNAWIQGDMTCSASDTEGRLAVGGTATLQDYNVNCVTYSPPDQHECVGFGAVSCLSIKSDDPGLVGNAISATRGQLTAGVVAYGSAFTDNNFQIDLNCPTIHDSSYAQYVQASFPALVQQSAGWASYAVTGQTTVQYYGPQSQITLSTNNRFGIFNVDGNDLNVCSSFTISVPANAKLVLINVSGATVEMVNFQIFGVTDDLRHKIMWNFYEATRLAIENMSPEGSIFAPSADLTGINGHINGQVFAKSFKTNGSLGVCTQINWWQFTGTFPDTPPSPPAGTCGNNIVESGEDCDGGACCTSTCTFTASTVVCRPVAGDCDVAEYCSGVSSQCPPDSFQPTTTPCGSPFGVCDVQLVEHCPGNAATCKAAPPATLFYWDAFNVISFDEFHVAGGDVEGRLAVRNLVNVSGFTIGLKTLPTDAFSYFDLVVAGNAVYTDGSVNNGPGNNNGAIAVGGTFTAPQYLQDLLAANVFVSGTVFDDAQAYYNVVGGKIAALGTNAAASLIYGDGLSLTCADPNSAMYIAQVPISMFNQVNWYITSGCKLTAAWLITLTGTDDITIKGAPFPGIVERVVYNIQGSQTIYAQNGVAANILAPNAAFEQSVGVTYGKVIVGNVIEARQNNKPECLNFANIELTTKNLVAVQAGDDFIYVYDLAAYIPGDLLCYNGNCGKIVSGLEDENGKAVVLEQGFPANVPAMSTFTTEIVNPTDASRSGSLPIQQQSGASALVASAVLVSAAALLL